ncbi:MAG TPA: right-handed parallel beta-helix repeat-containing protein [bacterium]|nr:right-handed parallel beta-helix repeat-containing protein [bacterium]HXK94548.1 right-handed parallel beta-helix repeat-containing protein [bacterium]
MMKKITIRVCVAAVCFFRILTVPGAEERVDYSPKADEQQIPRAMHSAMTELPRITVGLSNADFTGTDNRVLQAAVDFIAGLGGGVVDIGEGEYIMHDSLHLRPFVTVRGVPGKTILRKADGVVSPLALDGDYGEEQITLVDPTGFRPGYGVAIWDSRAGGFHVTVARITGRKGNTISIDTPCMADYMVKNQAQAATVFPVISGYNLEGARIKDLVIEGNKENNVPLNGCRGAGIFLYRGFGTVIENCVARNYNGDGISFQQSNDVQVLDCVSENNAVLGIHPGSGSQRPLVRGCVARRNGSDGLFLCWRVRHGVFEENVLEENGQFGISIGHKDSDNLLRKNVVRFNQRDGIFFRNESLGMAGHRNRLEENLIENNGTKEGGAGIRIRGETNGLVFVKNIIRDTRPISEQTQTTGIKIEERAGDIEIRENTIEAQEPLVDLRPK